MNDLDFYNLVNLAIPQYMIVNGDPFPYVDYR